MVVLSSEYTLLVSILLICSLNEIACVLLFVTLLSWILIVGEGVLVSVNKIRILVVVIILFISLALSLIFRFQNFANNNDYRVKVCFHFVFS